ncbi:Dyp-type peroxidase [Kineosporia babensis]|uniref:Dyp-type peroxidase n=1 Tax=Kineosporia babensis TaxID=499548 RepID=A0A9X1T277_9ACTN|nr:Dyp-type peroxidase [Kineosporia babensis]MCD5314338.1 Dyp-type peroxidase [Kineosporia babensis]
MDPKEQPQPVLTPLTEAAVILVLTQEEGTEDEVYDLLPDVAGISRSVGFRAPDDELNCIVGIGSGLWDRLFGDGPRPIGLHPFIELEGARHRAPSTPGDLVVHIRARRMDLCFELATHLKARLKGARVVDETHGFKYFDMRDLLGFVDGTENPTGPAAVKAVTIGEEDPQFAGGSYLIVQKYRHDVDAWNAISVEEQERAVGRTKLSDLELAEDLKPANSHVALTTLEDESGEQLQIMRDNMPFGRIGEGEFGTYFIGYSATPAITEKMLHNMFVGDPEGNTDRLLDFSTAVTGSLFFVPTADFLDKPPSRGE